MSALMGPVVVKISNEIFLQERGKSARILSETELRMVRGYVCSSVYETSISLSVCGRVSRSYQPTRTFSVIM